MPKALSFETPLSLAIAEGATTPNPGNPGVVVWSTSTSALMRWNGTAWNALGTGASPDPLTLSVSSPSAPPSDKLTLFAKSVGGRITPTFIGPAGQDSVLQEHIIRNCFNAWIPQQGLTTMVSLGTGLSNTGTLTASTKATTNIHTLINRIDYLVTVAATTAVAGWRTAVANWLVGSPLAGQGGFHLVQRFGPATGVATTTNRCFVGMTAGTTAPTDVEPSSITNIVGAGWDAADTNIQIMHRGAGAVTKIDLGASFPVPTADRTKAYELALFSKPGTTQEVKYTFTDLGTGAVASGTISTNLPTTSTFLGARGWMSVGGTSSVIGIAHMGCSISTDF